MSLTFIPNYLIKRDALDATVRAKANQNTFEINTFLIFLESED